MTEITVRDESGIPVTVQADAFFIFIVRNGCVYVLRSDRLDCEAAEALCNSMYGQAEEIEEKLPAAIINATWESSRKQPEDFAVWLHSILNLAPEAGHSPHEP
jgi:hypothetical protein